MAIYMWRELGPLCFTANTAGSTVQLTKTGSPTSINLETSTNGSTWSNYYVGNTITLSNVGDTVYIRNKSTTTTRFSTASNAYYHFIISGSIAASGDVTTLLNKSGTSNLSDYCFFFLFNDCTSLTTTPTLLATSLAKSCYASMFYGCTSLLTLPELPATTLNEMCYRSMFYGCSNIKLSTTQTGAYQTPYRIPKSGTGTVGTNSLEYMFTSTGGTFTSDPSINTTYYTSNTVV